MHVPRKSIPIRKLSSFLNRCASLFSAIFLVFCGVSQQAWASTAATTTTLAVTSAANMVTTISAGSVITLTAIVIVGGAPVTSGQVNFCDATAKYCTDIHLLGNAQLTNNGTATLKIIPSLGTHSYDAVFVGTTDNAASASTTLALEVTAAQSGMEPLATTSTIAESGVPGNYTLTATVAGNESLGPTGTVAFLNTSNTNSVLGTAVLIPVTAGTGFVNSSNPGTSNNSRLVVSADFNLDGVPDLAVLGDTITVLLGKGDGTFTVAPGAAISAGLTAAIAVGDFNGDGIPDLILTASIDDVPGTVLLGNGDGTFRSAQALSMGNNSDSVAVGDFNGDGNLDLAITSICPFGGIPNSIYIFLGKGDGTFSQAASLLPGTNPVFIAVGDFNGDGKTDLAVANNGSNTLTILLGNGDGTFSAAASPATGTNPTSLVVADFNTDGKPDLAVTNSGSNTVTVLLGNGDGTFTTAASPATGTSPRSIAVADFNADGKPDLAVTNFGSNTVTVLLGNGDGTFTTAANPATGNGPVSIVTANFNGDNKVDLAVANNISGTATVLLGGLKSSTATVNNIAPASAGTNLVDASYSGDNNFASSISSSVMLIGPSFTLSSTPVSISSPGASGTSTITVIPSNGFTGDVALSCAVLGSDVLGHATCQIATPVTVSGSVVTQTLTINTQPTDSSGQYVVAVTGVFAGITETTMVPFLVSPSATSPQFTIGSTPVSIPAPGASGTSTVTITPSNGFTGNVLLTCAVTGIPLGAAVSPSCSFSSAPGTTSEEVRILGTAAATATLNINTPPGISPGQYTVTVTGSCGDAVVIETTSIAVPVALPMPAFSLNSTPVSIPSPGASGTSTITITPSNGFTGMVTFTCTVTGDPMNPIDPPTCLPIPPVMIEATEAVTASVVINTTAATVTAFQSPRQLILKGGGGTPFAALLLLSLTIRRQRWKPFLTLLAFATIIGTVIGCGGATTGIVTATPTGTTTGNYIVTVTATSGATTANALVHITVN
jgi:hypothetical protein